MVVGLALKKFQGIFQFLVVERDLRPYGTVDDSLPAYATYGNDPNFNIHDALVHENRDYHTLTWDKRSVNLDTFVLPAGKVVTGVRFRVVAGALTLQVRGTDFDFALGILINTENSGWYMSTKGNRTELLLEEPDISTNAKEKSIPFSLPDRFIKFGPTDRHKDISQTTVPFIDAQLVESHAPTLLSGVGLYYKGTPGYGGFIAPKILNYNFASHLTDLEV